MSLFVVGMIAGVGVLAGLMVTLAEQVRVAVKRQRAVVRTEQVTRQTEFTGPNFPRTALPSNNATSRDACTAPEDRATAYRHILDNLGDDLDRDIAEWEAVLEEFPQVLLADDCLAFEARSSPLVSEPEYQNRLPAEDQAAAPKRSRRVDPEERGQIIRLLNTGFAPEEIALWLNLPLERVQELLDRP